MTTLRETRVLPLLADPDGYTACRWDLSAEAGMRDYWLGLFRNHFPHLIEEALHEAADLGQDLEETRRRTDAAEADFYRYLDALEADPFNAGRLTILDICEERERVLRRHDFDDPYRLAKHRQNEMALGVLPRVLEELDAMDDAEREVAVIEGIFAGNIFDMGATHTNSLFKGGGSVDFHDTREQLRPRPWLVDDLEAWLGRKRHRSALLFVDNAGPDIVLGMIPLARHLLRGGARVILTANDEPSLNDVTIAELRELLDEVARIDPLMADALADGRLTAVGSGNGAPLIDLSRISPALHDAVATTDVDLVVLEGMGRGVESNLDAAFTCDAMKIAMIKDRGVADALGGELYDLVCRYEPA